MRKSKLLLTIVLPVTVLIIALSFGVRSIIGLTKQAQAKSENPPTTQSENNESQAPAISQTATPSKTQEQGFLVKISENKITVYSVLDVENPIKIINFDISSLPDYDISLLQEGVFLKTVTELTAFLEDFSE